MAKFFADSNVILYTVQDDKIKSAIARAIVRRRPTISVQVLNEFVRVALGKFKMPIEMIVVNLAPIRQACEVVALTEAMHARAVDLTRVHKLGIFDANILAAAELSNCDVLYTEDLNHGQRIGNVLIQNPFMVA